MDTLIAIVLVLVAAFVLLLVAGGLLVWAVTIWCQFVAVLLEAGAEPSKK